MELYIPYMIGSSVSMFVGKVAYDYYTIPTDDTPNSDSISNTISDSKTIDYSLVDEKLNETKVDSSSKLKDISLNEKIELLQDILSKECNRNIRNNNTKNVTQKWLRVIKEYENLGHDEFVKRYKK